MPYCTINQLYLIDRIDSLTKPSFPLHFTSEDSSNK